MGEIIVMRRAIIIEDEKNAADLLEKMITDAELSVEIISKCRDLQEGIINIRKHTPDIVFLDIEMPVYSGIELLDFLKPEEINFQIIFTTAYSEYAIRAFEMSAVAYLLKPIQEDKLRLALEKAITHPKLNTINYLPVLKQNMEQKALKKMVIAVVSGFEVINLSDVCYLKAEGSYTEIFFKDGGSMLTSKNLKHFEFILSDTRSFIRVHRSFIVNACFIKKLLSKEGGAIVLDNKTELPVSDDKMEIVLELLRNI